METITLTGRSSKLSLIQIDLVREKIEKAFPNIRVIVKPCSSLGDRLQNVPLQTAEGTDFFTEEVFQTLYTGEADIAVHSLKDMSAAHFFGGNYFAVVDRDEVRDVAIFNPAVLQKLKAGLTITIGTCSPRRELMAKDFLKQALPQLHDNINIETKAIRGNVDTRLRKLDAGEYDGIILAAAGLNRLLRNPEHSPAIKALLNTKKLMVLPLIECVPAPCQGAIVAEAIPENKNAMKVLEQIQQTELLDQCSREKKIALRYGAGCDQKFGVTTISYANQKSFFAAGKNGENRSFEDWFDLPAPNPDGKNIWDGVQKASGGVEEFELQNNISKPVVFISNNNAIHTNAISKIQEKRVWAAGSKTWFKLAKKGIWVEGCADGLGLESLIKVWHSPLVDIKKSQVTILTHEIAAESWRKKDWDAHASYRVASNLTPDTKNIQLAKILFWSSSLQFRQLKHLANPNALHACASGETYQQIRQSGIEPLVFPTIQSFQQWKTRATHSPTEG
jgi:hydroxymethylbilane synthase